MKLPIPVNTLTCGPTPRVGDEIIYAYPDPPHRPEGGRLYLAIRIGPDGQNPGSELWWAWNEQTGTLSTYSVGKFWLLNREPNAPTECDILTW